MPTKLEHVSHLLTPASSKVRSNTKLTLWPSLLMKLCLALTLGPSIFTHFSSPSLHTHSLVPITPLCSAAPAFWSPIADALGNPDDPWDILSGKTCDQPASEVNSSGINGSSPAHAGTLQTSNTGVKPQNNSKVIDPNPQLLTTAADYGVVHLDLEGDPNCDYTAKVRVAGSEYNVIIDTGSAHFAIASSACQDCIIPRKGHYQQGEEEEIPIDPDCTLIGDLGSYESCVMPVSYDHNHDLFNFINQRSEYVAHADPQVPILTTSPTSSSEAMWIHATTEVPVPTPILSILPQPALSTTSTRFNYVLSLWNSSSTVVAINRQPMALRLQLNGDDWNEGCSSGFKKHLRATQPYLLSAIPTAIHSLLSRINTNIVIPTLTMVIPATRTGSSSPLILRSSKTAPIHGPTIVTTTLAAVGQFKPPFVNRTRRMERRLVAAPAKDLYPLSETSRDIGEHVRVSYGLSTHSVGWDGVQTSDLMTMEMAKVSLQQVSNTTGLSSLPTLGASNGGKKPSGIKGIIEKETNVGFVAIVENKGFFSQECGAQHGIWGLGYRSLSADQRPTLFGTLSAAMKIPNGFALQLCGRVSNTTKSGNMFLGGFSSAHLAEPMQFVPLVRKDWYQVQLDGFKVMGEPIQGMQNLNLPKTIVDSGTTNIIMSHYNLRFLIQSLAQSGIVRWSPLIPDQDISDFWFQNAVLRLPRSSFRVSTVARAVEAVISGVSIPIYTSSFLKIKPVPAGQAPEGYVDFWWHGFSSSTPADMIEAEEASGGAVIPGSVGTILGETLFTGKIVYFERGNEDARPGDTDFGRIGFGRGKNCYRPADHASVDVLANGGKIADITESRPVRVTATGTGLNNVPIGDTWHTQPSGALPPETTFFDTHFHGLPGPARILGSASQLCQRLNPWYSVILGLFMVMISVNI